MKNYKETKRFYEAHPYPSQRVESTGDLKAKKHEEIMERILFCLGTDKNGIRGKTVLDAGCGTGEKSLYLAMQGAKPTGFDISSSSIEIARANAKKLGLDANFMVESFEEFNIEGKQKHYMKSYGNFDFVICIGSLHHSANPRGNFMRMARMVKPGGAICIGLYHKYGRMKVKIKRALFWHGESDYEKVIAKIGIGKNAPPTARASISDRLASPHESYHTIGEVKEWFDEAGFHEMKSYPKTNLDSGLAICKTELEWLAKGTGFFFMGGVKKFKKNFFRCGNWQMA